MYCFMLVAVLAILVPLPAHELDGSEWASLMIRVSSVSAAAGSVVYNFAESGRVQRWVWHSVVLCAAIRLYGMSILWSKYDVFAIAMVVTICWRMWSWNRTILGDECAILYCALFLLLAMLGFFQKRLVGLHAEATDPLMERGVSSQPIWLAIGFIIATMSLTPSFCNLLHWWQGNADRHDRVLPDVEGQQIPGTVPCSIVPCSSHSSNVAPPTGTPESALSETAWRQSFEPLGDVDRLALIAGGIRMYATSDVGNDPQPPPPVPTDRSVRKQNLLGLLYICANWRKLPPLAIYTTACFLDAAFAPLEEMGSLSQRTEVAWRRETVAPLVTRSSSSEPDPPRSAIRRV